MTRRRAAVTAGAVLVALGGAGAASAAPPAPPAVHAAAATGRPVAMLTAATTVRARPAPAARRIATVAASRPITGTPTVLPVVARARGADGALWVRVLVPGRPNGRSGWIPVASADLATTSWTVTVRLSARRVDVSRDGRRVRSFAAVIGAPSTPTPTGRFFVEETVGLAADLAGTPYALALSARSQVFQEFAGGPGQVAIHGTANVGGTPGTAVSHGCIRLPTAAIVWLAAHAGPGTPVTVVR